MKVTILYQKIKVTIPIPEYQDIDSVTTEHQVNDPITPSDLNEVDPPINSPNKCKSTKPRYSLR